MLMSEANSESILFDDDKMAAISSIVGTIAHDFNNLLMPLLAYPELIRSDLPEGSNSRELLDVIEKTSKDMVYITEQLLRLSTKDSSFSKSLVDVNDVVSASISQLTSKGTIPPDVAIRTSVAPDVNEVCGAVDQLVLAVYNLCLNAVEAVGDKGTVKVVAENATVAGGTNAAEMLHGEGKYVKISVIDSGSGIPVNIKKLIFNPFFTTKKSRNRRGAGLGLSVTYKIVKNHGGYIDFESKQGEGTAFDVYLPAVDSGKRKGTQMISAEIKANVSRELVKCDHGRVLVVDDEKTILRLFQMILSSGINACTIDIAANGQEAVEAFSRHHHAVIVMDLHMPVMDGQAAFFRIQQLCEENSWQMPSVVFCTGFAPPDSINDVIDKSTKHCLLAKPVGGDALVEAVKSRAGK